MNLKTIKPPSRRQLITLRLMIVIGLACMGFFLHSLLKTSVVGYKPLYWLLIATFVYTFFKIIYEWYHYWSISVPATPQITKHYTVDIFTTFCAGEPYEMIVETLTAIQAITYPHQTYLCDEADDPYLRSVCKELGVNHVTRAVKIDAKAGNINNALRQSSGELCVVLDPDHIPAPGFLDPIISHFDNPEIGYVQIVQAYYNQDMGWIAKGAAQQTYQFYGPMMMCMNSYGTVQALGANCTFRRSALESIGGHAAGLAEDMHTAMQLHARKWKSVYVPKVLTRGLVPATLSAYYKQQLKWSRGVFELLVTSYVKLFKKFTWRQKLHYGLLPLFYLSGFVFLINFLLPVIALFGDVYPLKMDFSAFIIISIPFISSVVLIRHYVQQWVMEDNERGFHVVGGFLLIGTWWVFILGFVYTLIRKKVPYIATPKDVQDEKNLKNNLPNIFVLLISITAIVYALYNDWNPFTLFMSGIAGLNCLFMVFMLVASSELKSRQYVAHNSSLSTIAVGVRGLKKRFWFFRRRVYVWIRSASLPLMILAVSFCFYMSTRSDRETGTTLSVYNSRYLYAQAHPYSGKKPLVNSNQLDTDTLALSKLMRQAANSNPPAPDAMDVRAGRLPSPNYLLSTRGVGYDKGHYWQGNRFPLTKTIINQDFEEMKEAGINTVKIYGPNIYDRSTFDVAGQQGLKIYYSFWIPDPSYFINDTDNLTKLSKTILETVNKNKTNPAIIAWGLGNSTLQQLDNYYRKPQLFYARNNYCKWLRQLVKDIKLADPNRIVTVDVLSSPNVNETVNLLHEQIAEIDAFGLIISKQSALKNISGGLKAPYFFSSVDPKMAINSDLPVGGIIYANWQDQSTGSTVTFDGLKDIWGRNKPYLASISTSWHGKIIKNDLPPVKILKPALTALAGASLNYSALVYLNDQWNLGANIKTGLFYEWYLVKTDGFGNAVSISSIGNGPAVSVNMPQNINVYRLYLVASKGNNATDATSILNIPLKN